MKPDMMFTLIKPTEKNVTLEWQQKFGDLTADTRLAAELTPPPGLAKALADFKPEVLKLLTLPKAWGEDLQVRSVAIKWKPDGDRKGITVSLAKPIADSNAPLNISTPFLPAPSEDGSFGMSGRMLACLEELEEQALQFVEGHRAQVELFGDASSNGKHEAPARQQREPKEELAGAGA